MNSNPRKAASAEQVADDGVAIDRIVLIGELIACEAKRLARLAEQTGNIEPLQRMGWILGDAMEQVYNQLGYLKYSLHISDKGTTTDQNGGQGDE